MSIPVIIKHAGQEVPPLAAGGLRYVVARNGLFLERASTMYRTICRVEACAAGLADHREQFEYCCGPLGAELAGEMVDFFRWAYRTHDGEAALTLLHDPARGEFRWHCPRQRVELYETWSGRWYNRGDIRYSAPLELPPGFVVLGDAHSHADLAAFSSSVDQQDERYMDGLHIVVGRVHLPEVEVFAEFVMDGHRFAVEPAAVLPTLAIRSANGPAGTQDTEARFPAAWMEQVEIVRRPYLHHEGYGYGHGHGRNAGAWNGSY